MNSKLKKIFVIMFIVVFLLIAVFTYYKFFYKDTIDAIEMDKRSSIISKYPDIIKQFAFFQHNCFVELYEYTDKPSYPDTLMRYYFLKNNIDRKKIFNITKNIDNHIKNIEMNNVNDNILLLYYYGMVQHKYRMPISNSLKECLYKYENYFLTTDSNNDDVGLLNNIQRLYSTFDILGIKPKNNVLKSKIDEFKPTDIDELSMKSYSIIKCCEEGDPEKIEKSILHIVDCYNKKEIDLETLIIYLNIYDDKYLKLVDSKIINEITDFCITDYYKLPSYISFVGFKISEIYNHKMDDEIKNIFLNKPENNEGYVPSVAQIVPTYRRIFQYSEICHVLGINLDKASVYEICENIDPDKMMNEDYYYQTLLSRNYPDLKVNVEGLKKIIEKAEKVDINLSNYYSYFYIIKAGLMNDIECSKLINKLQNFQVSNKTDGNYLVKKICDAEIEYISSAKKKKTIDFSEEIANYSGESPIETFYQYAVYMKSISQKCPDKVKKKITTTISKYYTKMDYGAGFWLNSEFKYIDIAQTYECLFLKNFVLE